MALCLGRQLVSCPSGDGALQQGPPEAPRRRGSRSDTTSTSSPPQEINSVLTPSTWRQQQTPQVKGSGLPSPACPRPQPAQPRCQGRVQPVTPVSDPLGWRSEVLTSPLLESQWFPSRGWELPCRPPHVSAWPPAQKPAKPLPSGVSWGLQSQARLIKSVALSDGFNLQPPLPRPKVGRR